MRNVILLALIACTPAFAGEVYKCKGPTGEITFTNIKCPDHTASEHYATYQPEPDSPPPAPATPVAQAAPESPVVSGVSTSAPVPAPQPVAAPTNPLPAQATIPSASQLPTQQPPARPFEPPMQPAIQEAARPVAPHVVQPTDAPDPSAATAPPPVASGYKCIDGDTVWLQSTPCPSAQAHAIARPVEAPVVNAAPVKAPADMPATSSADGNASSQGPLCDQLIAQASAAGHQKGGTGTDELNKLMAANGCKR